MPESIHRLMVSPELFDLATQAIRAHSLATRKFQSINSTIASAAELVLGRPCMDGEMAPVLHEFSLDGPIRIHLIVRHSWSGLFKSASARLAEAAAQPLTVKQSVCLLFGVFLQNYR